MNIILHAAVVAATLSVGVAASATTAASADLPRNGTVATRFGKLELRQGFPTQATVRKVYDEIDYQRASQAYLWALPYVMMGEWQRQQREQLGASSLDYVHYASVADRLSILTPNSVTPYALAFPDLAETGPLVLDIPPGALAGGILDFWQRPLSDIGQTGPDRGRGGKFLILGPGHADMQPEGHFVLRSPTNNLWVGMRGLGADQEKARAVLTQMRMYPYADPSPTTPTRHLFLQGKRWRAGQPTGLDYWAALARLVNAEPALERDRIMLASLLPLGIAKGQPFAPDARQKRILEEAAAAGEVMARTLSYAKRQPGARIWPDRQWEYALLLNETNQEAEHHTQLDERSAWFYEAVGVTSGMLGKTVGAGQLYLEAQKDSSGAWFDGGKTYRLRVPADVPAAQFWSFSLYDNETRSFIESDSAPERSSRNALSKNADGSTDLWFAPAQPAGVVAANWVKTAPGHGWFGYFRLYAPTQVWFDKTWTLPDIEPITKEKK